MATDRGTGTEGFGIGQSLVERGGWVATFQLEKFDAPIEWYAFKAVKAHGTQDEIDQVYRVLGNGGSGLWNEIPEKFQFAADAAFRAQNRPKEITEFHNNLLSGGVQELFVVVIGTAAPTTNSGAAAPGATASFTGTQARLAIGDSSTAFANTQTWLQAATNKYAQVMDASFPAASVVSNVAQVQFKVTVTGTNANFVWNEICTDNGGGSNSVTGASATYTGTTCLNRAVSAQGTKASGATWALTETIQIS